MPIADARIRVANRAFSAHPDLRAELVEAFGDVTFNDAGERLDGEALVAFLQGADGAVVGLEQVDDALLDRLPGLRIVAKFGVGLDNIDVDACERHGVAVGWTGGVNRLSVAEMTLGFMIGLTRNLFMTARQLADGTWNKNGGVQLSGKTVGIVGVGHIGKEVVRLLQPFGCRILANDIVDQADFYAANGIEAADKETIWREADVVTIHTPLTAETRGLIDGAALARFKPGSVLINTARGGIVDEAALKRALIEGPLKAAALDVYLTEPPGDPALLALPNMVATPHIGGNAEEAVLAMGRSAIRHLVDFFGTAR